MESDGRKGARAYVPGVKNDVFISYCHCDNTPETPGGPPWITYFVEKLTEKVSNSLGQPVQVWWDKKLGGDHALDLEIKERIENTAVFLAIVSPRYLNSASCREERECFRRAFRDNLFVGSRMRGLRVVKTPMSDGDHRTVFEETLGFEFFVAPEDDPTDAVEFLLDSSEYRDVFGKLCRRVTGLLDTLRRQQVAVYVAHCSPALKDERARVVAELADNGYQVLPNIEIDSMNVAGVAGRGLKAAQLSVHLFGTHVHELSIEQARIAMRSDRALLVWTSQPELHTDPSEYGQFLLELMKRSHYLDRSPIESVKAAALALLEPNGQSAPSKNNQASRRVYIVCNRREAEDVRRVWQLKKWIVEQDRFEVDVPELAPLDPADLIQDHHRKLANCEGLLLYWGQASGDWFETSRRDLEARQFRSGAIALGDPNRSAAGVVRAPVIPFYPGSPYTALEPFLAPLRK